MNGLKIDLMPSKKLLLTHEVIESLSKTFQRHRVRILERKMNKSLRLKISFDRRRKLLKKEIDRYQQRAKETKGSIQFKVFKDMIKALRAEATAIGNDFLLTIAEDKVVMETNLAEKISELSAFYTEMYFGQIISIIRESYVIIGENICFQKESQNTSQRQN